MELNLTNHRWLTPFELAFLVNGLRDLWMTDRYVEVTVTAHREVCRQIRMLTRWVGGWELHKRGMSDYNPILRRREDVITLVEVPRIEDRYFGKMWSGQFSQSEMT